MKKLLIISSILITAPIYRGLAQPNGSFENWSTTFGVIDPDNWQTGNLLSLLSPPNPLSAFKAIGVDKHSGNYALKLQTIYLNNNPDPNLFLDTMGIAFTGKILINPVSSTMGYPYTGRPAMLEFWAKYQPVGGDNAEVGVLLKKWNGVSSDTVAFGSVIIGAVSQYTLFQCNLVYRLPELPDSAGIALSSSLKTTARVGSTLFIDDLAFTGWVGIDEYNNYTDKVKIYPNPAKENITIDAQISEADNVQVDDVSGKLIGVYKIRNYSTNINTGAFSEGIYFYRIRDKNNKILTNGKFNVTK